MTITAQMICDSISPENIRISTLQLRYPKFIHGEFMTHRVFSRNASSSRAIPVERLIKDVLDDPVYPSHWGKNQPGMSANEEHNGSVRSPMLGTNDTREDAWDEARTRAIEIAQEFARAGYHKQIVNRLLEPFCHINVVVTATDWTNFFALRRHPDTQPEMRMLADAIHAAMDESRPIEVEPDGWHLPYVRLSDVAMTNATLIDSAAFKHQLIKISVARCARVSYLTQEGKQPDPEADLKLYDRLVGAVPLHASPAEHQATPDRLSKRGVVATLNGPQWHSPHLQGNFRGWVQYRKTLPGENQ